MTLCDDCGRLQFWQAWNVSKMCFLASSAEMCSSIIGRWVIYDWLMLLSHQGLITATLFWLPHRRESQASGSPFWMLLSDQNSEVWAWWSVMADCSSEGAIEACCCPSLSSALSSKISCRLLYSCVWSSWLPACMVCQLLSTVCCSWCSFGSHALCCRTNGLECSARWSAGSSI